MTTRRTPTHYSDEFKSRAVGMVLDGRGVNSVASDLGIARSCLQRWKKRHLQGLDEAVPAGGRSASDMSAEIDRLRRQLADVSEQRGILKKTIRIFGEEGPWTRRR